MGRGNHGGIVVVADFVAGMLMENGMGEAEWGSLALIRSSMAYTM